MRNRRQSGFAKPLQFVNHLIITIPISLTTQMGTGDDSDDHAAAVDADVSLDFVGDGVAVGAALLPFVRSRRPYTDLRGR